MTSLALRRAFATGAGTGRYERVKRERGCVEDPRDIELRAHPPRMVGPNGPMSYRLPFVDAIAEVAEVASRQGWPGRSTHLADPPNLCGRHIHAAPRSP